LVSEKDSQLFWELIKKVGCVVVGRTTYDQYKGNVFPVPGAMTFVWTSAPDTLAVVEGVQPIAADTAHELLLKLETKGFSEVVLAGGSKTNSAFVSEKLVDEVVANVYPVIFGRGIPLVAGNTCELALTLVENTTLDDGICRHHYMVNK
jgi:dihydrofolate reductase